MEKTCIKFDGPNHFAQCCAKSKKSVLSITSAKGARDPQGPPVTDSIVHVVSDRHKPNGIYAEMDIGGRKTKFQLDTGAAVNVLPLLSLPVDTKMTPSTNSLKTYDGSQLHTIGTTVLHITNPVTDKCNKVTFEVASGNHMPLLGALAVQKLHLLSVNENNFKRVGTVTAHSAPVNKEVVLQIYAAVFDDTIGDLPQLAHLITDPAVTPVVLFARKTSFLHGESYASRTITTGNSWCSWACRRANQLGQSYSCCGQTK